MTENCDNQEKRAYKRFSADDHCWAQVDASDKLAIKNISLFGTCLVVPRHMDKDNTCQITVSSDNKAAITLSGYVIWSYPLGPETSGDGGTLYYETGFKFAELDDSQKNMLQEFITSLQ